ncbi:MAG: histidinol-phosphatase [Bacteroidetes bacterium]|jgi:predicted ATPase|nr:histidinol-phosphatase [Bacteroidota bacterium]
MDKVDIFKNGAIWVRADFHLHTKADKEFIYTGNENDFCRLYVEQLKSQNINVGVITNHNKFDKNEFVALRKKALKEGIGLFAGVELSVNDGANGIHCLLVFDYEKWCINGEDFINQFLTAAFEGIANRENENTRCKYNFETVLQKLNEHANNGRDSFIILAHVEQNSGFFNELDGGRIQQFVSNDLFSHFVLGFQKVRTYDKIATWKTWFGDKLPAFVEGSDCKNIEEIGRPHQQNGEVKTTYIKIGDFNFEALRYALTDFNYRVKLNSKPEIKNSYIKSIAFEGGLLDETKIDFSPELNTLIGIRGSGKSSILEILRYTLGIPLSPTAVDPRYKDGLIENVLRSGGKSIVTIVNKQKEEYRIEKIYGQKEDIYKGDVLQPNISVSAAFDYPVYFGQKDLSNKDADFEADLIQRLVGTRLKDIQSKIEQKKREVGNIVAEIKKLRNLNDLKKETETVIKNAEHQLKFFKEKGVEDKLKQQTLFDFDVSKLSQSESSLRSYLNELHSLITNHDYFFQQEILGSEANKDFFDEARNLLKELKSEFEKLKAIQKSSVQLQEKYKVLIGKINVKKEGLKEEFAKIKREIGTDTINPDNFLTLNRQIDTSRLKLLEIDKSEKRRKEWQDDLLKRLSDLDNLWHEEYQLLEKEVNRINEADSKLSIAVEFKGRRDKFTDKMKQIFRGSGIRETAYQEVETTYKDFIQIYKDSSKLNTILNENQVVDFKRRFFENLEDLLTFKVDNKIIIQYNGKSLDKHSLGQRASALILFLLAQKENDVLIIDQPEDDLDNQTIYDEVIKELKKIKGNMQFLFATHNANIPVLGDSEKVVACSYDETKITVHSGSIDNHQTQRFIVDIMEGGDEAFSRRKNIYSIWNIEKLKTK